MLSLGIDLGGTTARAAVVGSDGRLVAVAKQALTDRQPAAVVEAIGQAVERALGGAKGAEVTGCGVGVAAQLDIPNGRVRVAPNLGWRDVPLSELLASRLGRPVWLVNDLAAAAFGELHAGAGRGQQDLLTIFVGTGVGSAIIANGRHVSGAGGVAGEFGHTKSVAEGGRRCGCGELGCLEAYAGGRNLIEQGQELLRAGKAPKLSALVKGDLEQVNPALIERAALDGDVEVKALYEQACDFLILACANYVTVLNPGRLIIGGGVLMNCPELKRALVEGIPKFASRTSQTGFSIVEAQLGDDSGIIGAGFYAQARTR